MTCILLTDLWKYNKLFRSPTEIARLRKYLVDHEMKEHVLKCFETGFVSHFEYPTPKPWGHVDNYDPLRSSSGKSALRAAMKKQVLQGKIIGGPG